MKLLSMLQGGKEKIGIKTNNGVIDLENTLEKYPNKSISSNMMELVHKGYEGVKNLQQYLSNIPKEGVNYLKENTIEFGPVLPEPSKIICVGLNYKKHADETNSSYPKEPILFNKFNNTLTGHKQQVRIPKVTKQLDYEVELGIVIGKETKEVSQEKALDCVFGYVTANDLSARDLQFTTSQWLLGKCCDDFTPIGPYLVTKDEINNPNNLNLKTRINGKEKQNSNTSDMIFHCDEIISYISNYMTLKPGDLILTGTPEGVILGSPQEERIFLQAGDEMCLEIDGLGELTNTLIDE